MGKRGKGPKKENRNPKRKVRDEGAYMEDMDDEIDAFHKQRDIIPLDINGNIGASDEDDEQPVFNMEEEEEEEDDDDDDIEDKGLSAKIARQSKFLRAKMGGVEDEMHDEGEAEEEKKFGWGGKNNLYGSENVDHEIQSSDDELPAEEEAEVLRLQRERAKLLSMEDFGLEDVNQDDNDGEPTIKEIVVEGKASIKSSVDKDAEVSTDTAYEEVKKDLSSLSREEQMDVVQSSAPELLGLLSDLKDSVEQLETKVNPLLSKVKQGEKTTKGGMHYLEVKQLLLMTYCQSITFYLLLKSEGHPVRDHPVIGRLVEIKSLLNKMQQLDENLPFELEEILNKIHGDSTELVKENASLAHDSLIRNQEPSLAKAKTQCAAAVAPEAVELVEMNSPKSNEKKKGEKRKRQNEVSEQSKEMLKLRASLEEKLKQNGSFTSDKAKDTAKKQYKQPVNGRLETFDDFDDETINMEGNTRGGGNGSANPSLSSKISQIVSTNKAKKAKIISGEDDLPVRDDIGERRRKFELRVLSGAGIRSEDDIFDGDVGFEGDKSPEMEEDDNGDEPEGPEDEFYKQVKQQRAAKLAAKEAIYKRDTGGVVEYLDDEMADGEKRQISLQIEKNRGLTRSRNKDKKNPRKNYRNKHQNAVKRRKGQVRDIRKPTGNYGGESTGINPIISRSTRFKN